MTISELKGDCYGCGACVQICPKDAICIQENERGFYVTAQFDAPQPKE